MTNRRQRDGYYYRLLCRMGYEAELEAILNHPHCDIDTSFIGFMDTYHMLSKIIPKGRTIIDLGCAYGAQAAFFTDHAHYVGVDEGSVRRLNTTNSKYLEMRIEDYLANLATARRQMNDMFAICNYVPLVADVQHRVRSMFPDLYVFYPQRGDREQR